MDELQQPTPKAVLSLLQLPFEIRQQVLYHVFFPVLPRATATIQPSSPPTEVYPNIPQNSPDKPNYRRFIHVSILRTCHQLFREGEFLLYRNLKINLMFRSWEDDYSESAARFLDRLNPRHRQLVRHVELKCFKTEQVPPLKEWKYLLYFLEIECRCLRVLRLWCPAGLGEKVLEGFRGEREWVRALLEIRMFEEDEEGVERVVTTG